MYNKTTIEKIYKRQYSDFILLGLVIIVCSMNVLAIIPNEHNNYYVIGTVIGSFAIIILYWMRCNNKW